MEKPHRESHVEVEEVRHANDGEIDEDVQPHAIAEQRQRVEHQPHLGHVKEVVVQPIQHLDGKGQREPDPHQRIAKQLWENALVVAAQHLQGHLCQRED